MRRQSVAAGLIRVVRHAEQESQAIGSAIPLQREAILRCREDLLALAARVKLEEPASSLGLTLAGELLTDVDSPLSRDRGVGDTRGLPAITVGLSNEWVTESRRLAADGQGVQR
jgi:hypothetical protein